MAPYNYVISPAPREPMLTETGELRRSWNSWFQDVVDGLNNHQGSIVAIPTSVADEVTNVYVQARQKYPQPFDVILSESASIVDIGQNFMANTTRVYVDERKVMKNTDAEFYYAEITENDGTRSRVEFSETLPLGTKIEIDFYQA